MTSRLQELPLAGRIAILAVIAALIVAVTRVLGAGPNSLGWFGVILEALVITILSLAFGLLAARMFSSDPVRSPARNYNRRITITMLIYAVVLVGSIFLFVHGWAAGPFGYVLAALPAAPIIAVFVVLGLYLKEETDEFTRRLFAEACLLGGAATFAEATFWGFLENFGKVQHVPMYAVSIAFFAQFGLANGLLRWRYR